MFCQSGLVFRAFLMSSKGVKVYPGWKLSISYHEVGFCYGWVNCKYFAISSFGVLST